MSIHRREGFTIVEVVLFVAITGVIMSFMLIGVGTQLNQQRYRDASSSFIGYLQNQYSLVGSVSNYRDSTIECSSGVDGGEIIVDGGNTIGRGQSDCTVVGRMLHSIDNGSIVTSTRVVATRDIGSLISSSSDDPDIDVLRDAHLVLDPSVEEYKTQWGTRLVESSSAYPPAEFSLLIVRMPTSGVIRTFVSDEADLSPSDLVDGGGPLGADLVRDFKVCLESGGLLGGNLRPTGVLVKANAANTSAVQMVSQGDC